MSRYFYHDLETDKLVIFTGGKADWMSLPESERDNIKRNCLWSRHRSCWVSRAKRGGSPWLRDILLKNGFEDRGAKGERLTFAESMERTMERAEECADRMEDRADKAAAESSALHKRADSMASVIPLGQPILVGHHSEKRDRNYRERIFNTMGKAVAASEKADYYRDRVRAALDTADGSKLKNPAFLGRRIAEAEAEERTFLRRLEGEGMLTPGPLPDDYRAHLEDRLSEVREKLAYYGEHLAACPGTRWNQENLKGMALVKVRGRWAKIVKLNPKTVSVPNLCFPEEASQIRWAMKYPYTEVQDAVTEEKAKLTPTELAAKRETEAKGGVS
jgi:hypothetical protein